MKKVKHVVKKSVTFKTTIVCRLMPEERSHLSDRIKRLYWISQEEEQHIIQQWYDEFEQITNEYFFESNNNSSSSSNCSNHDDENDQDEDEDIIENDLDDDDDITISSSPDDDDDNDNDNDKSQPKLPKQKMTIDCFRGYEALMIDKTTCDTVIKDVIQHQCVTDQYLEHVTE